MKQRTLALAIGVMSIVAIAAIIFAVVIQSNGTRDLEAAESSASETVTVLEVARADDAVQATTSAEHAMETVSVFEGGLATSEFQAAAAIETVAALGNAQATSDSLLADANSQLEQAATLEADSADEIAALSTAIAEKRRDSSEQLTQIRDLEAQLLCERVPESIDYSSNRSVSDSLKAWLEGVEGTIDSAEWDVIWNNTPAAIHRLTGEYLYAYVVYFDDAAFDRLTNRTFDVTNLCWLD